MHFSGFFRIKLIARLILKREIFGSHTISDQSLLLSTIVLNDYTDIRNKITRCNQVCENQPCQITTFFDCHVITHVLVQVTGNRMKFTPHMQKCVEKLIKFTE